jgi:mRNA-degrading endonuclease toxin of MazEF toxin-antitoxin module
MLRGEVRMVGFDPAVGSEATRQRPAVIVSNDRLNTTATRLGRSVDVSRIGRLVDVLPFALMRELDDALRLHLGL